MKLPSQDQLFLAAVFLLVFAFAAMCCAPEIVQGGYKVPPQGVE